MNNLAENKKWWTGFQEGHNFVIEKDTLTVKIYDPPKYSAKVIEVELNPHTTFGHELSHTLAGAFYFKGFDPSGAYLWGEKITDDYDPGRSLFYECWVIHGQVLTDTNVDMGFKLEHHKKGKQFLEETYPMLYQIPIPTKWIERWENLKENIDELTKFRKELPIDPWFPKGFKKFKLAKLN